jgi:DNA-binding NtrC family response regulator
VGAAPAIGGQPPQRTEPARAPSATDAAVPANAPAPSSSRALDGRHIVLLEDDNAVVELLELTLTARGARLTTVRTAEELPAALRSGRFDTLLLDLSPLGAEAESFIEQVQATHPGLVVIVISGSASPQTLADAWVRKPFEPSELVTAIARAHASSAAR